MDKYFSLDAPLYVNVRFRHDECSAGKDPCLIVTRFPTHWKYYCHRCKWSGEKVIENLPPEDIVKLWKANQIKRGVPNQQSDEVRLPLDFTNEIYEKCPKGAVWLMKYGITPHEISKYNIGYSPTYKRIIFPVYQNNELVYWQGRTVNEVTKDNPKWINIKQRGRKDIYFRATAGNAVTIVLVEDIISAIKVARHSECVALLGSYITDDLILSLALHRVLIWLDEDKKNEAVKYLMRMKSLGIAATLRVTSKDPKEYSTDEIKEILS